MDAANIFEFPLKWQKGKGLDPKENSLHVQYLDRLCDTMVEAVKEKIDAVSKAIESEGSHKTYLEAVHHSLYCKKKAGAFMVRKQDCLIIQYHKRNLHECVLGIYL